MNKIKFAYYMLLFLSAVEFGRGLQMIITPILSGGLNPHIQLTSLLQIIIAALLYFVARILKPSENNKSI
jgi:hypothetical protein